MPCGPRRPRHLRSARPMGLWYATLATVCLVLLASCGEQKEANQARFEEQCRAQGYAEGSKEMADCVERRWAVFRYQPRYGK